MMIAESMLSKRPVLRFPVASDDQLIALKFDIANRTVDVVIKDTAISARGRGFDSWADQIGKID